MQRKPASTLTSPPIYNPSRHVVLQAAQESNKDKKHRLNKEAKKKEESKQQSHEARQENAFNKYQTRADDATQQARVEQAKKTKKNLGHGSADSSQKTNNQTKGALGNINSASPTKQAAREEPVYRAPRAREKPSSKVKMPPDEFRNARQKAANSAASSWGGGAEAAKRAYISYCMRAGFTQYGFTEAKFKEWADAWVEEKEKDEPVVILDEHPSSKISFYKKDDPDKDGNGGSPDLLGGGGSFQLIEV